MSNLSQALWNECFAEGYVEGYVGSYVKLYAESVRSLSKNKQWTIEQAMDALDIASTERETYRNILKGNYLDQTGETSEIDNLGQDIWNRDFSEGFAEIRAESIHSLSKNRQWTLEQTISVLRIPEDEWNMYKDLLEQETPTA